MMKYGVLAFSSTHSAIQTEKFLRSRFSIQIMPTPRVITASCGISIRVSPDDLPAVRAALSELPDITDCWVAYGISEHGDAQRLV